MYWSKGVTLIYLFWTHYSRSHTKWLPSSHVGIPHPAVSRSCLVSIWNTGIQQFWIQYSMKFQHLPQLSTVSLHSGIETNQQLISVMNNISKHFKVILDSFYSFSHRILFSQFLLLNIPQSSLLSFAIITTFVHGIYYLLPYQLSNWSFFYSIFHNASLN